MAKDKQEITILEGNSFKGLKLKQKKKTEHKHFNKN